MSFALISHKLPSGFVKEKFPFYSSSLHAGALAFWFYLSIEWWPYVNTSNEKSSTESSDNIYII